MDDDAHPQRTTNFDHFPENERIVHMERLADSKDLNPIKIFGILSAILNVELLGDLETTLQEIWRLLDFAVVKNLVTSMDTNYTLCMAGEGALLPF